MSFDCAGVDHPSCDRTPLSLALHLRRLTSASLLTSALSPA